MNNKEVAHEWAQGGATNKGSHFYSEGVKLFSYGPHFLLGKLFPSSDRGEVALLNCDGYSATTRKHKSYAFGALCSTEWIVIEVPQPDVEEIKGTQGSLVEHLENLRYLKAQQIERLAKAPRAREALGRILEEIEEGQEKYNAYVRRFRLSKHAPKLPELSATGKAELQARAEHQENARADRERLREERAKVAEAENLSKWRRGENVQNSFWHSDIALRLSADGKKIETSRGASVDVSAGVALWKRWKAGFHLNLEKIGAYTVNESTPEGVKIGCHYIKADEINAFFAGLNIEA